MSITKTVVSDHETSHISLRAYVTGFVLSIGLTLLSYGLVVRKAGSTSTLVALVCTLALVQFAVQLVFFLHLGEERKPRWRVAMLALMVLVVFIIVFGSWWVIHNLDGRMMSPQQTQQYLKDQDGGI